MNSFPPPYEYRFHAGPYRVPEVQIGDVIHDEWLGDVPVDGFMDAPIQWPATTYLGKLIPILCGDLVRAVTEEVELAVAHYWGVSKYHIDKWKEGMTGGKTSGEVFTKLALMKQDPRFRRKFGYMSLLFFTSTYFSSWMFLGS